MLTLICLTAFAAAAEEEKSLLERITVEKSSWRVLLAPSKDLGLDQEGLTRTGALPRQIQKSLSDFKEHILSPQDKKRLREQARNKLLQEEYLKVLEQIDKRDELLFKEADPEKRRELEGKIDQEIEKIRTAIAEIEEFPIDEIPVPDKLRIQTLVLENLTEYQGALYYFEKDEADVVFWLEMGGQAGVYLTHLFAFDRSFSAPKKIWEGVISKDSEIHIDSIRDFLATLLLNRSWANLEVNLTPEEGRIYLDGELIGVGQVRINGLEPELPYEIEVLPQGYKSLRQQVVLEPYQTASFNWTLEEKADQYIVVNSGEVTADVYLGSRFIGYTPLKMRVPDYTQTLTVLAVGFLPVSQTITAGWEENIEIIFEPNPVLNAEKEIALRRETFYWSASALTLSVLLPLIAGGVADNAKNLALRNHNAGFNAAANRYQNEYNVASVFMWSGIAISGGLLVWTGINLVDYIQTIERNAQPNIRSTRPEELAQQAKEKEAKEKETEEAKS